jgi:hypothetical protein
LQPVVKVVEDYSKPVHLHPLLGQHYKIHQFICHVGELTAFQPITWINVDNPVAYIPFKRETFHPSRLTNASNGIFFWVN